MARPTTIYGFESFQTATNSAAHDSSWKKWINNSMNGLNLSANSGRNGGGCLLGDGNTPGFSDLVHDIPTTDSQGAATDAVRGLAFAHDRIGFGGVVAAFGEESLGVLQTIHFVVYIGAGGDIQVWRSAWNGDSNFGRIVLSNASVLLGSSLDGGQSGIIIPSSGYVHYEIENARVHSSLGSVDVYVNETLALTLSGQDTRNHVVGRTGLGEISAFGVRAGPAGHLTDLAWHSGDGRIGDCASRYLPATAAGTYTDGTAVGAGTKLQCVDEQSWNGNTDYVELDDSSLPAAISMQVTGVPASAIEILGVTPWVSAMKDAAGTNIIRPFIRSNSGGGPTEDDGGVDPLITTSYRGLSPGYFWVDPDTGVAFDISDINGGNIEVGARRTS